MTTQGRDFLISLPIVGSSVTNQMSPRLTNLAPRHPDCQTHPLRVRRHHARQSSSPQPPNRPAPPSRVCATPAHPARWSFLHALRARLARGVVLGSRFPV